MISSFSYQFFSWTGPESLLENPVTFNLAIKIIVTNLRGIFLVKNSIAPAMDKIKNRLTKEKKVMSKKLKEVLAENVKPAPYNPREISEHQYNGLANSMDKFGDISGITWNRRSGNLVTGHQRWNRLSREFGDLKLSQIKDDIYSIESTAKGPTGFKMRVVDWDMATERAANITGNNHAIGGTWEKESLKILLADIKQDSDSLFKDLNFDILESDLSMDFDEKEWESNLDNVGKVSANLNGMPARIIIECTPELKDEVLIYIKAKLLETSFEGVHIK